MKSITDLTVENRKLAGGLLVPGAGEIDRARSFPRQNIRELGRSGLLELDQIEQFVLLYPIRGTGPWRTATDPMRDWSDAAGR